MFKPFSKHHQHLNPEKFVAAITKQIQTSPQDWVLDESDVRVKAANYGLPLSDYREFEIVALVQEANVDGKPILMDRTAEDDSMIFFVLCD